MRLSRMAFVERFMLTIFLDLLRRMSIKQPEDPREAHPGLKLTGNVISATFAMPRSITFNGNDWV